MYNNTAKINALRQKTIKKAEKLRGKFEDDEEFLINTTELNTVKSLFQIRNGNFYKKKIIVKNLKNPISNYYLKERIFIAGKIFPVLNLIYKNYVDSFDSTKIEIKVWKNADAWNQPSTIYRNNVHNQSYISIDNDKLMILLPKSYSDIKFPELMLDFLKNGKDTFHTIGGEFPDYETYKLALREKAISLKDWKGQDGSWLTKDRAENSKTWQNAYIYIIKNKVKGRLAPFRQIFDFYNCVDYHLQYTFKHEVKWCKGAKRLVNALSSSPLGGVGSLEGGSNVIDDDVETILNELNLGICDYAIGKFHELMCGKYAKTPLKGNDAYNWDVAFITQEQGVIAPPIYKKTSTDTIKKFQKMADKDGFDENNGPSSLGTGSWFLNEITPAFDDFNPPALVTDDDFRIDLPLLMLYLDKHKINKKRVSPSLKNYLILNNNPDGLCLVNNKCKDIIKKFVV